MGVARLAVARAISDHIDKELLAPAAPVLGQVGQEPELPLPVVRLNRHGLPDRRHAMT